jgi:hypothetical protein
MGAAGFPHVSTHMPSGRAIASRIFMRSQGSLPRLLPRMRTSANRPLSF